MFPNEIARLMRMMDAHGVPAMDFTRRVEWLIEHQQPAAPVVCEWKQDSDDESIWESTCGHFFYFDESLPEENGFEFCPFCGKKLASSTATLTDIPCPACRDNRLDGEPCPICDHPR